MKYLKFYEEYSNYTTQEITMSQFDELVFDEWLDIKNECLPFSDKEIETIQNWISNNFNVDNYKTKKREILVGNPDDIYRTQPKNGEDIVQLSFDINDYEFSIMIYKMKDEWYPTVIYGYGQANCDQLGGLFEYLLKFKSEEL